MLFDLSDTEVRLLRAGLEDLHAKAGRAAMNPDQNAVAAMVHEVILDGCTGLMERLDGQREAGYAERMQLINSPY